TKSTSGDVTFSITGRDGATLRILVDASAGIDASRIRKGLDATFTGVVGQRASRKGELDGYRLWLRDSRDIAVNAQPSPTPSPTGTGSPNGSGSNAQATVIAIRQALLREGRTVTVEGVLTVDSSLLDASGRRTIVEDATGAIELYLARP